MAVDIPLMAFLAGLAIATALAVRARSREGEAGTMTMLDSGPVSYTHLTLPTICSV